MPAAASPVFSVLLRLTFYMTNGRSVLELIALTGVRSCPRAGCGRSACPCDMIVTLLPTSLPRVSANACSRPRSRSSYASKLNSR